MKAVHLHPIFDTCVLQWQEREPQCVQELATPCNTGWTAVALYYAIMTRKPSVDCFIFVCLPVYSCAAQQSVG
jgi:hypothetical protein